MLLLFPVSGVDHHLAIEVAEWIAQLGGVKNHIAALEFADCTPEASKERIRTAFKSAFRHVSEFRPNLGPDDVGWPNGANAMFYSAAEWMAALGQSDCWYFFEPDNTPIVPEWLDKLEYEYRTCGRLFMGVLEQSWIVPSGMMGNRIPAGRHLVGTAIYPKYLSAHTMLHHPLHCRGRAFDVALQPDLEWQSHHTNQIQHNWLTENYRREADGVIRCDSREGRLPGQKGFSLPRPVHPGAVVVHGCKDLSLLRLLRAERSGNQVIQPVPPEPKPTVAVETEALGPIPDNEEEPSWV